MAESIHAKCLATREIDGRTDTCRKSKGHDASARQVGRMHFDPDSRQVWYTATIEYFEIGQRVTQEAWDTANGGLRCNAGRIGKIVAKYTARVDVRFDGDERVYRIHPDCLRRF
jgi:hypothetical protein